MTDSLLLLSTTIPLGIAARLLWRGGRLMAAFFLISLGVSIFVAALRPTPLAPLSGQPQIHRTDGYLGSSACAECHPGKTHSFSQTYHRTMTRSPRELRRDEMLAFPARLEAQGRIFELRRSFADPRRLELVGPDLHHIAEQLLRLTERSSSGPRDDAEPNQVRTFDPDARVTAIFQDAPVVQRELVLVTGSHHYLAFWVEKGADEELRQLPFVWLLDEKSWVPREEAFLAPPGSLPHLARWNGSCIQCHSVAGMPREHDGKYNTSVADLGISCEGCHGPGEEHAASMRSPLARFSERNGFGARGPDRSSSIFSPTRASSAEASARCGECHAYFAPKDPEKWWETGFVGGREAQNRKITELPGLPDRVLIEPDRPDIAASVGLSRSLESIFWPDGSVIVGGREYSGLIRSACYQRGQGKSQLGCLDCHSMHDADPNDQLKSDWQTRCTACHEGHSNGLAAHSRHSSTVGCGDCHMPKTSYALLSAIRSHRISVPDPVSVGPPSACLLCHTTETRAWLIQGYELLFASSASFGSHDASRTAPRAARVPPQTSRTEPPLVEPHPEHPLALELALSGNALTRALLIRALVDPVALELSGMAYPSAILRELLHDPYPAVRRIAQRSIDELTSRPPSSGSGDKATLKNLRAARVPSREIFSELHQKRDDRDITISE